MKIIGFDLFVIFLTMLCTYLDLKTTFFYEIAVIFSSVWILFHEDSTAVFHIFIVKFHHLDWTYSIRAVWVKP